MDEEDGVQHLLLVCGLNFSAEAHLLQVFAGDGIQIVSG